MIDITDYEFRQLADLVEKNYGITLKDEKKTLVTGRLHPILLKHNFNSFSEYLRHLGADRSGEAASTLIDRITTNHTFFMREAEHFHYLRDKALPEIIRTNRQKDLRIWSAGCSTGEEPATLAMLLDEYFGPEKALWDSKILATDISSQALETAARGVYENTSLATLPAHWRLNYFRRLDPQRSVLADRIRSEIIYRRFNLMDGQFPFKKKFHVIFCRNVMIYFDSQTRDELVRKFYDMTEPGGYLFIGHSETLNREKSGYKYIMPAVYRKGWDT